MPETVSYNQPAGPERSAVSKKEGELVGPMRVLIVDDHEFSRRGLRVLLSGNPQWVICGEAVDGLDGVEKAKALQPDVVLMDVSMPRMNGLEATRVLRRELPSAPIILVSQNDPAIVRRQAQEVDAAAFVAKGNVAKDLLPTLERVKSRQNSGSSAPPKPAEGIFSSTASWVAGGSELAQLIREKDWFGTTLGPLDRWPQSLRIAVNLMLNSRHPMWLGWGPDMPFLYNDAYLSVLGLAKHPSALGRPAREVWSEIWDICGPLAEKVFKEGEATFVDDVHFYMNRGDFLEETYVSFSYNPIFDESGKIAGLFCPNTDTTPKILNARRLHTLSELAAKALIERSSEAACASCFATIAKNPDDIPFALLYLLDSDGAVAQLEQSAGVSGGLSRICPATIALESKSAESQFWKMDEALRNLRPQIVSLRDLESAPIGPAGQRVLQAIALPVTSGRLDRPIGILIAGINPTRKLDSEYQTFYELLSSQAAAAIQNARAAEDERKRAEALAELDRAKTVFFNNVSHEFRTPLTLMLGPVEDLLARSHTDLTPAAKNQLELVNRNGSRLLRLVNTLLDFSRIEAGRMQVVYQPTDLSAFTLELASVFRSATEKAGLKLNLDCPRLPEPAYVDRDMWEKIVLNLISNAFKFTFEGEIGVSLAKTSNGVELRIRDTGVGIPANELPRLFDRFHRVQNTRSRTHEGTGIGLALVQELVKLHGGSIRVESAVGEGSTFIVRLPLGNAHLPADRIGGNRSLATTAVGATPFLDEVLGWLPANGQLTSAEELPSESELLPVPCPPVSSGDEGSERARPRVLIADDNADMRKYLVRLLAERYKVSAYPNGQVALEAVRGRAPDLILSDVMMPELDGFGLLRELRADDRTSTIPIILLSARAGEESRVEGMQHGADDYLIKPFSARELLARVQTHLELSRVRKQSEEALRRRSAQVETLLDAAPLAVYLVDADLRIRHINPPARLVFGEIPDLIGRDLNEVVRILWPKEHADDVIERFRHTLETGEPYFVPEHIENRADRGVREFYEWQINRIPLPDGRYGVVCYFRDISRLVLSRELIAESEKRLRLATEAVELGIWSWNPAEDRATWENDRVYEIFGRTHEDGPLSRAEFLEKIIHSEDRKSFETALAHALDTGAHFFSQYRIHRKDGSLAWVEQTGQIEPAADGKPARLVGTVLDITERNRALEMLSQHRERFDLVAQAAQVGFWFCDLPFDKLAWDNLVKEHFWLPPDGEVTIETFYERLHPDDRERTRQAIAESIEKNIQYDIEYRTVADDGREKWIRAMGRTFYDGAGSPKRFDGVTLDVTERKHKEVARKMAEQALRESEERFRAIVETTPECVKLVAGDGTILHMNSSGLRIMGADSVEEIVGKNIYDIIAPKDREKYRLFHERICDGETGNLDFDIVGLKGIARHMESHAAPFRMTDGSIVHLAVTGDVTERERAAEELRRSEDKLRTLAGELEIQVLTRTRELEERNQEVLRQSEQLRDLSNRLLQAQDQERRHIARELHDSAGQIVTVLGIYLARIGQGTLQNSAHVTKDVEECQQLVQQLNKEIRTTSYLLYPPLLDEMGLQEALRWYIQGLMDRTGLDIKFNVPDGFGRLPREMELIVYRLVQECLTNIHRHSGSKTAVIDFKREGETFSLKIQDSGAGISPEKLKLLQSQGGGVGIRGMRERIRQFGGRMDIHSSDRGTTISFIFQLPDDHSPEPENIEQQGNAAPWNVPRTPGKDFAGADSD